MANLFEIAKEKGVIKDPRPSSKTKKTFSKKKKLIRSLYSQRLCE